MKQTKQEMNLCNYIGTECGAMYRATIDFVNPEEARREIENAANRARGALYFAAFHNNMRISENRLTELETGIKENKRIALNMLANRKR